MLHGLSIRGLVLIETLGLKYWSYWLKLIENLDVRL